jgi:hypothetical protein
MGRQLHACALIIRIKESDHHPAAQSLDHNPVFGREVLAVFGEKVSLDVTRTSPLETAEQADSRLLVYVLLVPCELLGTPKAFVAIGTAKSHLAVHVTTAAVLPVGVNGYMPPEPGPVGTSLGYVSSDRGRPGDAHFVGRQLGLRSHWQLNGVSDSWFEGWTLCRDTE